MIPSHVHVLCIIKVDLEFIFFASTQDLQYHAVHCCEGSLGKFTANVCDDIGDLKLNNVLKNIFSKLNHGTVPELTI